MGRRFCRPPAARLRKNAARGGILGKGYNSDDTFIIFRCIYG